MKLAIGYLLHNHHLYTDNFYSSPILIRDLHYAETYFCGTIRKNRSPASCSREGRVRNYRQIVTLFCQWYDKRDVYVMATNTTGREIVKPRSRLTPNEMVTVPEMIIDNMGGSNPKKKLLMYSMWLQKFHLFRYILFIQCGNGKPILCLRLALLMVCRDIEINHGPAPSVYLCGICELPVDWSDVAVTCDECSIWYRKSSLEMSTSKFENINCSNVFWICMKCCTIHTEPHLFNCRDPSGKRYVCALRAHCT